MSANALIWACQENHLVQLSAIPNNPSFLYTACPVAIICFHAYYDYVAKFAGRAALDDLMTESALQSFITDQAAFDDRIHQIAAKL